MDRCARSREICAIGVLMLAVRRCRARANAHRALLLHRSSGQRPGQDGCPRQHHRAVGFVVKGEDGKLSVQNSGDTKSGETVTARTASTTIPSSAVAGIHGHIDNGPHRSNGMVDDPKSNGNYGDTQSLRAGMPMATVSRGQVGWHEMQDGQLQFTYPAGALNGSQNQQMQNNLNVEQLNFQQP
nr:hypothetical protein [Fulvimonas soli]